MTEAERIAGLVRKRLAELGETAREVERRAGLPEDYIGSVLDAKYPFLRNAMTARIADALGVSREVFRVDGKGARRRKDVSAVEPVQLHPSTELARLRGSIDNIDAALIHMLAERFKATKAVGELKATHGMPPADKVREAEQIERLRLLARQADLDPDFAEKFLAFIVTEVIRHHEKLQEGKR